MFLMIHVLLVMTVTFPLRFWRLRAFHRHVQRGGHDAAASTRPATSTDLPGAGKQGPKTCIKTVGTGSENLYKNGEEKKRTRNPL